MGGGLPVPVLKPQCFQTALCPGCNELLWPQCWGWGWGAKPSASLKLQRHKLETDTALGNSQRPEDSSGDVGGASYLLQWLEGIIKQ